jgi:endonuclease/exonuclease/phosphatase family metal-dependent hydrolase
LFGLAYPIILIVHLLLLITWIFFDYRWSIILGAVLLIGGTSHFRTFALGGGDDPGNDTTLSIMSYNVRLFDRYNPSRDQSLVNKNKILKVISDRNPDVICFQEFYHQDQPTSFVTKDTILQLLNVKDYHERYIHKLAGRQNFGIATFSKFPVIEKGGINFPGDETTFNYCIYTDIIKESDTFRVYNVHLQSIRLQTDDYAMFEKDGNYSESGIFSIVNKIRKAYPIRADQAKLVVNHISNSPYPVIICGDFNDTPLSYVYNQFNRKLTDAFRNSSWGIGKTYAGKIPAGRIDYIFHSNSLGSRNFVVHREKLSDHFAISCEVFGKKN